MTDQTTTPPTEVPARATARRQLEALGLTEHQAVALLLPVIAETYREVADDAEDGAHGGTWGTTPEEALTGFAAAYRKVAADCDLPGAPLPEATRALERERAAHEERRRQLADALGLIDAREWADMIDQVRVIRDAASERADLLEEARDALEAARQTGAHGDDWPAVAPAIRALAAERDDLRKRAETAEEKVRDYENRTSWETTCGEHARLLDACQAAEADARRAMEQRQQMAAERYTWQERGDRAEAAAKVCREDAEYNATRAETAEAALARVRELHPQYRSPLTDEYDTCAHCNRISGDLVPYPCDTIQALGEQS